MIWLAIGMQVVSSLFFASGAVLQSLGVRSTFDPSGTASSNTLTFAGLLSLFKIRKWLLGLLLVFTGAALHVVALSLAPVAVVQPVGILAVPWSVILAARIHKHKLSHRMWIAVGITVAGVVGFTVLSTLFATGVKRVEFAEIFISFLVVCSICGVLSYLATRAAPWAKAMMWSSVGATFYGLGSGLVKAAMDLVLKHGQSLAGFEVVATLAMMLACFGLGVWMIQQGYASGPPEITVGTMTTVDPFVAVIFGLIVLGEGIGMGVGPAVGMAATGAIAVFGVLLLSRDHPEAIEERRVLAEADENPPSSDPLTS